MLPRIRRKFAPVNQNKNSSSIKFSSPQLKNNKINLNNRSFIQKIKFYLFKFKSNTLVFRLIIFLIIFLGLGTLIMNLSYKHANVFKINKLNYIEESSIKSDIANYLKQNTFITLDSSKLEKNLKNKYPLIKESFITKSFIHGVIIEIEEYKPLAIINTSQGNQYYYTSMNTLVPYDNRSENLSIINLNIDYDYSENDANILSLLLKASRFVSTLEDNNTQARYTIDNSGNLSILIGESKQARVDLKEKYFTIDEQLKVFQNALNKITFKELDLRTNNLIVKN